MVSSMQSSVQYMGLNGKYDFSIVLAFTEEVTTFMLVFICIYSFRMSINAVPDSFSQKQWPTTCR